MGPKRAAGRCALSRIVSPNDLEVRLRANGIEQVVMDLRPERLAPAREEAVA